MKRSAGKSYLSLNLMRSRLKGKVVGWHRGPFGGKKKKTWKRTYLASSGEIFTEYVRSGRQLTPKRIQIMRYLKAKGLPVEEILRFEGRDVVTCSHGEKNLLGFLREDEISTEDVQSIVNRCLTILFKVFKEGVSHGHPHFGNFAFDGKTITLLDFTRAKRFKKPNLSAFRRDINWFLDDFVDLINKAHSKKTPLKNTFTVVQAIDFAEKIRSTYIAEAEKIAPMNKFSAWLLDKLDKI